MVIFLLILSKSVFFQGDKRQNHVVSCEYPQYKEFHFMDPMEIMNALEKLDRQNQQENENNPWLIYVAEKGENSCRECVKNHGKRFRQNDLSRPALPVHPNCRCNYVELNKKIQKFLPNVPLLYMLQILQVLVVLKSPVETICSKSWKKFADRELFMN